MRVAGRLVLGAVGTLMVFAACSSSNDDGASSSSSGGTLEDGGSVTLADGATAACGRNTALCPQGQPCTGPEDCESNFCQTICTTASHVDGKQDDGETGIDCGGTAPTKCPPGQGCVSNADCDNVACDVGKTNLCLPASHTDGIKNGDETGTDCGGSAPTKCPAGQGCKTNADCNNLACDPTTMVCDPQSNTDGVKNGDETGIDCGGPTAPNKCPPGQGCATTADCANTLCNTTTLVCDPPSSTDGLKNGTETDIDCGGGAPTNASPCAVGLQCAGVDTNCASSVCNYAKKCVESPSCRNQHGGDTCGPDGANESCCVSPAAAGMHLDKYSITAGRMRTFVNDPAINGNIHDWLVNHKPAGWNDAWTAYLPTMMDNGGNTPDDNTAWSGFYQDVGPYNHPPFGGGNEGCRIRGNGARTYRLPDAVNTRINDEQDYPQDFLDERPMNCTPMPIFAAFCAWDGGQLATSAVLDSPWAGTYPWGNPTQAENAGANNPGVGNPAGYDVPYPSDPKGTFGFETYGTFNSNPKVAAPFNPNPDELWANYSFNYWGGASQVSSKTCDNSKGSDYYCDQSIFISPPGRFPNGNSPSGHSDLAGNVFNETPSPSGANYYWSRNGSWEAHQIPYPRSTFPIYDKYLAAGGRCMRP